MRESCIDAVHFNLREYAYSSLFILFMKLGAIQFHNIHVHVIWIDQTLIPENETTVLEREKETNCYMVTETLL